MAYLGLLLALSLGLGALSTAEVLTDISGTTSLTLEPTSDGINVELLRNGRHQLSGVIAKGKDFSAVSCSSLGSCLLSEREQLTIVPLQGGYNVTVVSENTEQVLQSCFDLNSANTHWFGGPQRYHQVWPLEKITLNGSEPYIIKKADNFGVAERYWLNSHGSYLWFSDNSPLWVSQNEDGQDQVCFKAEAKSPYINRWRVVLSYIVGSQDDPKQAHLEVVNNYLGKPTTRPADKIIQQPIWTTWAKYKKPIDDASVLEFAETIRSHGYNGGQLEIDDNWERCYGAQEFDSTKFSDIANTVSKLHADDWTVSLWIHPFVNDDCQDNADIGKSLEYFVRNPAGETNAVWWNGDNGLQIDFTKPEAAKWWSDRLVNIRNSYGFDSFKFDAGEDDYVNQPPVYEDVENSPNILNQKYIETCMEFGDLIEVRSSFRGQTYGKLIRMLDKDSVWGLENGLATLVTTLLQLNMNGYVMVLPDMIGGNGYQQQPNGELIVRWTQANTFMPVMQFSFLPWDYADEIPEIEAIVKKYVDLHEEYAPLILNAMSLSIESGNPVNPPIWWVDPSDTIAHSIDDEYLLGEEILVAPVVVEGATSRDIYLPKGEWKDGNDGTVYTGPVTILDYPAPIEVLPYFIKQ